VPPELLECLPDPFLASLNRFTRNQLGKFVVAKVCFIWRERRQTSQVGIANIFKNAETDCCCLRC